MLLSSFSVLLGRTMSFTASRFAVFMEKVRSPMPSSSRVKRVSPAISPHTDTGLPMRLAVRMMWASSLMMAGCAGW